MAGNGNDAGFEVIISSDSHVMEPSDILAERAPQVISKTKCRAFPSCKSAAVFRLIPADRIRRTESPRWRPTGVSAEVLYPTYLLPHFAMDDAKLQEVSFRAYNDWLIEYCNSFAQAVDRHRGDLGLQYRRGGKRTRTLRQGRHERLDHLASAPSGSAVSFGALQ